MITKEEYAFLLKEIVLARTESARVLMDHAEMCTRLRSQNIEIGTIVAPDDMRALKKEQVQGMVQRAAQSGIALPRFSEGL